MTSLHVIGDLGPPNQTYGYAYGMEWRTIFHTSIPGSY